jgi:formylglycine-generating enzyme required for sulfatase activity/uncharacterized caspase-like protein
MPNKYALIIGNTEYTDPGLAQLTAPGKDAEDFARVLRDKEIGSFDEVDILLNQPEYVVREAIDDFYNQKKPDDLLILYFSGHGVRDELGALYLAVKNTNRAKLKSTAIKSDYVRDAMDQSRSKRQVLILDCCNSGAFAQGTKSATGVSIGTATAFDSGYGRIILTASDSTQFAWEGDKVIGNTNNSLFTHYLVEGLKGEADHNSDGRITVDDLYDYAYEKVRLATPKQTPSKFSTKQQGEIVLRQSTRVENIKPQPLPADLVEEIDDTRPYVREAAVQQLEKILKGKNIGLAHSAREALERLAQEDDSRRVAQVAKQALEANRLAGQKLEEQKEESKKDAQATRTAVLRREQIEQASRFKIEQDKLLQEKAELEKSLKEERERSERIAREKAEAEQKAKENNQAFTAQKIERGKVEKAAHEKKAGPVFAKPEAKKVQKIPMWGIGLLALAIISLCSWGVYKIVPRMFAPSPTQALVVSPVPTEAITTPKTSMPWPTETLILTPTLGIGSTMISDKDGATLVYVPEGEFTMGSDTQSDEQPIHKVNLAAFWIDQTEVTNYLFSSFVSTTGYQTDAEKTGSSYLYDGTNWTQTNGADWQHPTGPDSDILGKEKHPVIHVSWNDSIAYCKWTGRRLPTEAEWEKAARGTDARIYPWGNYAPNDTLLNYNQKIGDTTEVGSYETGKSIYGAYDMAGNVWEWVNDWYQSDYYATLGDNASNPQGPSSGNGRVLRGGSWFNLVSVTSTYRSVNNPANAFDYGGFGFRCARSP